MLSRHPSHIKFTCLSFSLNQDVTYSAVGGATWCVAIAIWVRPTYARLWAAARSRCTMHDAATFTKTHALLCPRHEANLLTGVSSRDFFHISPESIGIMVPGQQGGARGVWRRLLGQLPEGRSVTAVTETAALPTEAQLLPGERRCFAIGQAGGGVMAARAPCTNFDQFRQRQTWGDGLVPSAHADATAILFSF